jgi:hypothetical protein
MRSVPKRGSGFVSFAFHIPILDFSVEHRPLPTRYRVVVLTSSHPVNGYVSKENLKLYPYLKLL